MKHTNLALATSAAALLVAAALPFPAPGATSQAAATRPAAASGAAERLHEQLRALFAASDEAYLQRNPLDALSRGDLRYADRFGDLLSDAYFAAEKSAAEADLAALAKLDRAALAPDDRISYDVFRYTRDMDRRGLEPALLRPVVLRPIDHFVGVQTFMPQLASGESLAPFGSVADYENNLKRLEGYIAFLDASIARMRDGVAAGIVQPKLVVRNVVEQLDNLLAEGVEGSTFYRPIRKFPDAVPLTDRERLTAN
jgi:uncharacterized protein (DUF885 family)